MIEEYDERTCITVGELKAMGIEMHDPRIPDCAWIPRHAMRMGVGEVTGDKDKNMISGKLIFTFTEPFRWITVDVTLEPGQEIEQ